MRDRRRILLLFISILNLTLLPFSMDAASLDMRVAGSTGGTVSPANTQDVNIGQAISITAIADDGYEFIKWIGLMNCEITDSTASETTVTVSGDAIVYAKFRKYIKNIIFIDDVSLKLKNSRENKDKVEVNDAYLPFSEQDFSTSDTISVYMDFFEFKCDGGTWKTKGDESEGHIYTYKSNNNSDYKISSLVFDFQQKVWSFKASKGNISTHYDLSGDISVILEINGETYGNTLTSSDKTLEEKTKWKIDADDGTFSKVTGTYYSYKENKDKITIKKAAISNADNLTFDDVTLWINDYSVTISSDEFTPRNNKYTYKSEDSTLKLEIDLEKYLWSFKLKKSSCSEIAGVEYFDIILKIGETEVSRISITSEFKTKMTFETSTDPTMTIMLWNREKTCDGTTLFPEVYNTDSPRVIEVDMYGNIVWEYYLTDEHKDYIQPGFDAELLDTGNILIVLPQKGIIEIDKDGVIQWEHYDAKVSHDADRLDNGNTIYSYGNNDTVDDAHVKEVNASGKLVWSWYAKDHYNKVPYSDISNQGWVHTNAVTRLDNGNTMISLRNFNLTTIVDSNGDIVEEYDWTAYGETTYPHEPEMQANGNILIGLQDDSPYSSVEVVSGDVNNVVWSFPSDGLRTTRDADRLSNGNTLLVTVDTTAEGQESIMLEITPGGDVVWEFRYRNAELSLQPGYFFKAQRVESSD